MKGHLAKGMMKGGMLKGIGLLKMVFFGFFILIAIIVGFILFFAMRKRRDNEIIETEIVEDTKIIKR
jgi:hypothetical protein